MTDEEKQRIDSALTTLKLANMVSLRTKVLQALQINSLTEMGIEQKIMMVGFLDRYLADAGDWLRSIDKGHTK